MKKRTLTTQTTINSDIGKPNESTIVKKPLLTRKRQIDDHCFQKEFHYIPTARTKEPTTLLKKCSFDDLKTQVVENGLVGEIKYLSPHFARCNIFTSPPQKKDTEGKQKFMRKQGNNQETMRERNINKNQP